MTMTHYRLTKRGLFSIIIVLIVGLMAWFSGGLFLAYFGLIVSGLFIVALGYELFLNKDKETNSKDKV